MTEQSLKEACEIVEAHLRKLCGRSKIQMRFNPDGVTLLANTGSKEYVYKEEASLYDALKDRSKL